MRDPLFPPLDGFLLYVRSSLPNENRVRSRVIFFLGPGQKDKPDNKSKRQKTDHIDSTFIFETGRAFIENMAAETKAINSNHIVWSGNSFGAKVVISGQEFAIH